MNDNDLIEYIDSTPLEANWLLVELPLNPPQRNLVRHRGSTLNKAKAFMADIGLRINIDFKMSPYYHSTKVVFYLNPEQEKYLSWIMLKWDPNWS